MTTFPIVSKILNMGLIVLIIKGYHNYELVFYVYSGSCGGHYFLLKVI